jgi:hypothetical protein
MTRSIVVVNVPFSGQTGSKPMIVCPISSQPRHYQKPGAGDHPLKQWKTVGLHHPSTARISNILAVEKKLIKRVLGTLHGEDLTRIEHGLREAFGL